MARYEKRIGKHGITWTTRIDAGVDPQSGERRQKRLSAKTRKELDAKVAKARNEVHTGTYIHTSRMTLGEYLEDRWLPTVKQSVKYPTYAAYERNTRNHIAPALGHVQLSKLTPLQVQTFYTDKVEAGLSPTTVRLMHSILNQSLKQAERMGMVPRNVCGLVDPPRPAAVTTATWTAEQAARFIEATAGDELGPLWALALVSGMRQGELLGLRWGDVDWGRAQVAVRRTLTIIDGKRAFHSPKTGHERSVSVSQGILDVLRGHQERQQETYDYIGAPWSEGVLVFQRADQKPYDPQYILSVFKRSAKRAGVPEIRFHDLRHTSATLMMGANIHPRIVQAQLGHANVSMTLDRYSHAGATMQGDAAQTLSETVGLGVVRDTSVTNLAGDGAESAPTQAAGE